MMPAFFRNINTRLVNSPIPFAARQGVLSARVAEFERRVVEPGRLGGNSTPCTSSEAIFLDLTLKRADTDAQSIACLGPMSSGAGQRKTDGIPLDLVQRHAGLDEQL